MTASNIKLLQPGAIVLRSEYGAKGFIYPAEDSGSIVNWKTRKVKLFSSLCDFTTGQKLAAVMFNSVLYWVHPRDLLEYE